MKRETYPIILILFLISLFQAGQSAAVEITASVSRNKVAVNESFQLTLRAKENPDGEPDFTPLLTDFDILDQSQNQNIQMINGNISRSISWNLTLMAGAPGIIRIPSISFGNDRSNPIPIEVLEAGSSHDAKPEDDLFLKLEIEPETAYIQQQLLLRIRLYRTVRLGEASFSPPRPDDSDTIIQRMGEDTQFETRIDGRSYLVTERRYTLFPQKNGRLNIGPVTFQGEVFEARAGSSDLFRSPFRRFGQRGKIRRLRSESLSIEIKPIPATASSDPWLPSDNLRLAEEWPGQVPEFRAGEPVTRTLVLFADGLTSAQLPTIATSLPAGIKQYPDQPLLRNQTGAGGITGMRQEKIAIVPATAGEYTLPAIEIPWWNTETDQPELARIPERKIRVIANPGSITTDKEMASGPVRTRKENTESLTPLSAGESDAPASGKLWPWLIALALGIGWLLTVIFFRWRRDHEWRRPKTEQRPSTEKPKERKTSLNEVKRSCLSNYPEIAATALLQWAKQQWPESEPRSLGVLTKLLGGDAAKEIEKLEKILYSPSAQSEWRGEKLWNALEAELNSSPQTTKEERLAPLHPL